MRNDWTLYNDDEKLIKTLVDELNITVLTAKILLHRGITTVEEADNFLNVDTKYKFHDPFLMKGMPEAVDRIIKAVDKREKIAIYGDYDVDGMTASSIMLHTLKRFDASVQSYIPDRMNEGYGLNVPALEKLIAAGITLLISVDCGIANANEITAVKDKLDIIVTDHHLTQEPINDAFAVIDPHQSNCNYPYKDLCGAGIAFKLSQALQNKIKGVDIQDYIDDIDLAALATVADIVPLTGENRKIVKLGLKQMSDTKNIGLRNLIEVAKLTGKKINAGHVGFNIAPRLNSTGRLATASRGVTLLTTEDEEFAKRIAEELETENIVRKNKEQQMLITANQKYIDMRRRKGGDMSSIVIAAEDWHPGIIGLTASKFVEKHYLPTIVIAVQDGIARGSCRSIAALNMKETLDYFKSYFTQYGGHAAAAGFSIKPKDINQFREDFDSYVKDKLTDDDFIPKKNIDALVNPSLIQIQSVDELEKLSPFGINNPQPVLAYSDIKGDNVKAMGGNNAHLSFMIKSDDASRKDMRAVAWSKGAFVSLVENEKVDITFMPTKDEFQGNVKVQCIVNTLEPSQATGLFPNRDVMINIYRFLRSCSDEADFKPFDICKLNTAFKKSTYANENVQQNSIYTMSCAIKVFEELGLMCFSFNNGGYFMPKATKKFALNESRFWRINSGQTV